eukprot:8893039-Ditylum_brightwellii.AAC.1
MMIEQNLPSMLAQRLRIHPYARRRDNLEYSTASGITEILNSPLMTSWRKLADSVDDPDSECTIAMVGKYCDQGDA